jgi:hypothetical protein
MASETPGSGTAPAVTADGAAPSDEDAAAAIGGIIESAERLGIEMDAKEAAEWLEAMAVAPGAGDVVVDMAAGVFGHRISMLDFRADDLDRFRAIGRIVGLDDRPGEVSTALALSGSAAQGRIQAYPGDCDFFERVHITAPTRQDACRILGDVMREKALATMTSPTYRLLEVKFGTYHEALLKDGKPIKPGNAISWTPAELTAGVTELTHNDGTPVTITWQQAAEDPGWCKLDWIIADPIRRRVSNASNMLDVTWEAPDGSIVALDGFIDPYYQEIYLEPASMPVFAKIAKQLTGSSLERYVDELEHEVRKYAGSDANYGKAARRMYNVFRLTGRFEEAAYIRELFDEPATVLYQVWSLVRSLEEASEPGSQIDASTLVGQVDELIMAAVKVLEGPSESEILSILLRLRDNLLRRTQGDDTVVEADVVAARQAAMKAVNEYFYARLIALPAIRDYLESVAASA